MLWIEEARNNAAMRAYDMTEISFKPDQDSLRHGIYTLEVPALAEGRPSLMKGDNVFLRDKFKGYIKNIQAKIIKFKLTELTNYRRYYIEDKKFDIIFEPSRVSAKRLHLALDRSRYIKRALFPDKHAAREERPIFDIDESEDIKWYSHPNEFQKKAVINILRSVYRPLPYILFGPPGTGKTVIQFTKSIAQDLSSRY